MPATYRLSVSVFAGCSENDPQEGYLEHKDEEAAAQRSEQYEKASAP